MEYRRLAREKRVRLGTYFHLAVDSLLTLSAAAGKGVKKNGLYLHDRAASFESLPPGPDPRSVARDIHQILPKLTKRGTFFKPSQATIDQRINELQALVDALFAEDVPTLVKDLTSDRTIIDFFGYWRRDHDLDAKSKGKETKPPSSKPRYSISSSVFSMYFNSSSHSTSQLPSPQSSMAEFPTDPPLPQRRLREPEDLPRPVSTTTIASSNVSSAHGCGESDIPVRPPMPNLVSSNSSPAPSTLGSKESLAVPSPIIVTEEFPIILDHSGDYVLDHQTHDRPWITLEALPEGHELKTGVPFPLEGGDEVTFPGKLSKRVVPEGHLLRNAKAFRPPPHSPPYTPPQSPLSKVHNPALPDADRSFESMRTLFQLTLQGAHGALTASKSSRLSWQSSLSTVSSDSSAAYLHDLNLALPPSPTEPAHNTRSSISSVASNMTNCSADAIIPRSLTQPTSPRTLPSRSRDRRRPASIPEEEAWPEAGEGSGKDGRGEQPSLPRVLASALTCFMCSYAPQESFVKTDDAGDRSSIPLPREERLPSAHPNSVVYPSPLAYGVPGRAKRAATPTAGHPLALAPPTQPAPPSNSRMLHPRVRDVRTHLARVPDRRPVHHRQSRVQQLHRRVPHPARHLLPGRAQAAAGKIRAAAGTAVVEHVHDRLRVAGDDRPGGRRRPGQGAHARDVPVHGWDTRPEEGPLRHVPGRVEVGRQLQRDGQADASHHRHDRVIFAARFRTLDFMGFFSSF
jgi:hypothetical protein